MVFFFKSRLEKSTFPARLLPKIVDVGERAGCLTHDWCGIPRGTPVNVAVGDFQCSMLANCKDPSFAGRNHRLHLIRTESFIFYDLFYFLSTS